jgi:hypothetical protein
MKLSYYFALITLGTITFISCKKDTPVAPAVAGVSGLNCAGTTFSATSTPGVAYNGTATVPYTGGNSTAYAAGTAITSTGVSGLTATLTAGTLANGAVYIFSQKVLKYIASEGISDISNELLCNFKGKIHAYHNESFHVDIGNLERLRFAQSFQATLPVKNKKDDWTYKFLESEIYQKINERLISVKNKTRKELQRFICI